MTSARKTEILGDNVYTVSGLADPRLCAGLIGEAEAAGFDAAPISAGGGFVMAPQVRNNTRVMYDDLVLAARLWTLLQPWVRTSRDGWQALGLNARFRIYRYHVGQRFRWHYDGAFHRSQTEQSLVTVMLYLNDDFEGGKTEFDDGEIHTVRPVCGDFLLFDHPIRHQGSTVTHGTKYVLRTDVMYVWQGEQGTGDAATTKGRRQSRGL